MSKALNLISIIAAFLFGTGILYLLMNATIGKLKILNSKFEWNGFQVKDFIFITAAAIILILTFDFVKPY